MVFDVRKNSERKRFKALELCVSISLESLKPPALVVSLPISAYKSASIEDPALLQSRLRKCELLPIGLVTIGHHCYCIVTIIHYYTQLSQVEKSSYSPGHVVWND